MVERPSLARRMQLRSLSDPRPLHVEGGYPGGMLPTLKSEMALAASIGFNTVRIWFPFNHWYHEREIALDRIDRVWDCSPNTDCR